MDKTNNNDYYWRCTVCGHEFDSEVLPNDYVCPTCGAFSPKFERMNRNDDNK